MTKARLRFLLTCISVFTLMTGGCSRRAAQAPVPSAIAPVKNAYVDLQPGWNLEVVVPVTKTGISGFRLTTQSGPNGLMSFAAPDLTGYAVCHYAIKGKQSSGVHLKFLSEETIIGGKAAPAAVAPALPFPLPGDTEHLRLIYLVRSSQADHNMAIAGSKRLKALNAFTERLIRNQEVCSSQEDIFCSWVPPGVAVRWNDR